MVIKAKFLLLFYFFSSLCLSSVLLSFGYQVPKLGTDLERCIDECREVEEEFSGLFACAARCERKYGEWEPETSPRELEQCRQRCLFEESDRREQKQCQRRCEELVSREREEERHRRQRQRDREGEGEYQWEREEREKQPEEREQYQGRKRNPEEEYRQCRQVCRRQEARQQPRCQGRCERQYEEQQGVGRREDENHHLHDPQRRYEQCRKQCERKEKGEQQQQQCKSWCEKQGEKEEKRREKQGNSLRENLGEEHQQRNNPYYFHAQRFQYRFRSQEGHMRVLQRFSQKSHLLRGIDNYRLAVLEANPSTLVVPHHSDAETILVVVKGRGVITLVSQERRESFNMDHGDVVRIPAGTTFYLINHDNVDRLQVAKLLQPVNTPGQFRQYFAAGGRGTPQSYYKVFSYDILERALNTPSEQLDRLFEGQQRQEGTIRKATQEQLRALSQHVTSPKRRGKDPRGPFNVLSRKPLYHNNFGRFFEATPNDYKQLEEIDSSVNFMEINQGAMMVPHYNSETTTIVLVIEGRGRFEMGCPHISRQGQESQERREQIEEVEEEEGESSGQLQKISANLSPGDVFIIPAGHPIALIASQNENLQTVGFGINALKNQRNFIAGKINIMNQVEREAMEIAFNIPARLIERIFSNNPKESYFVAGPELAGPEEEQQREEGRNYSGLSILDLAPLF